MGWDGPWHRVTQDMSEFMFVVKFLPSFWKKEVMAHTISFSISHPCWSSRLLQPLKSPLWGFTGWFEELTIVSIVIYHHCFINYCCHQMSSNRYICHKWLLLSIVPPNVKIWMLQWLGKTFLDTLWLTLISPVLSVFESLFFSDGLLAMAGVDLVIFSIWGYLCGIFTQICHLPLLWAWLTEICVKIFDLIVIPHRCVIADSAQTEYCPTFHCSCVRPFVCHRRDISHFSHI